MRLDMVDEIRETLYISCGDCESRTGRMVDMRRQDVALDVIALLDTDDTTLGRKGTGRSELRAWHKMSSSN